VPSSEAHTLSKRLEGQESSESRLKISWPRRGSPGADVAEVDDVRRKRKMAEEVMERSMIELVFFGRFDSTESFRIVDSLT
jgi:hypothetical protein